MPWKEQRSDNTEFQDRQQVYKNLDSIGTMERALALPAKKGADVDVVSWIGLRAERGGDKNEIRSTT